MSYRAVATATAIVSIVFGSALLIVPNSLGSLYGISSDVAAIYAGRLLGGSYIGYGIVSYLTRGTTDPGTRRAVAAANVFAWAVGFVVTLLAQLQGLMGATGWSTVLLELVFTIGWARTYAAERNS